MKIIYTAEERKKIDSVEDAYQKLIAECEEKIERLAPGDPPDDRELQKKRPKMPKPIKKDKDGTPIYAKADMDKYNELNQAINKEVDDQFNAWLASGSDEWQQARADYMSLIDKLNEARRDLYDKAERRQFSELGNSVTTIVEDAKKQVDWVIPYRYELISDAIDSDGLVSQYDIRVDEKTGKIYLDRSLLIDSIERSLLRLHFEALADEPEALAEIKLYIADTVAKSPYVSSTGKLGGDLRKYAKNITPSKKMLTAVRPRDYVTTVDKVSKLLFSDELSGLEMNTLQPVRLSNRKQKSNVLVYASINYDELIESGVFQQIPKLTDFDWWVHDGIITNLASGNRTMTIDMIYRAMTGKIDDKVHVSDDIYAKIRDSVHKFRGIATITNTLGETPEGEAIFNHREPLVMYKEDEVILNGKRVMAITVPNDIDSDPIVLRWARFNGNEIDTRDIRLLDVKGLNNGDESSTIKMYLYKRVIAMRHAYDESTLQRKPMKMSRKIKLETVYHKLGLVDPSRVKKQRVKEKIDKCLSFWQAGGLITGYTFTTASGSNAYDGVEIDFLPKLEG